MYKPTTKEQFALVDDLQNYCTYANVRLTAVMSRIGKPVIRAERTVEHADGSLTYEPIVDILLMSPRCKRWGDPFPPES